MNEVLRSTGRPLDLAVRSFMEVQFGHDFSRVRIHDDGTAAASAAAVRAKAYTVGSHVVFGAGYYSPGSSGKRLLAHELAHVVQQSRGGAAPPLAPGAAHETDAARAAAAVGGGSPVQVSAATGVGLACDNDPDVEAALKRLEEQEGSPEPNQPTKPTRQNALKPDELIDEHVFGPRVHEEVGDLRKRLANREARLKTNPNDKALQAEVSKMRVHLRTLEGSGLDPGARGANVPGVGNINTRAAIQVIGPDGKIIALERGSWGPNHHAEGDALAKLRMRLGTQKLPAGTRIMVGGNQVVCGEVCKPDIAQFAHDYGVPLENVSASVRTRPKVVGQGQASGKTTERTGLRGDVPKATVQTEPLFPGGKEPPTQPPLPKGPAVPKAPPQPKTPPVAATTTHEPLAGEVAPPKQAPISAPPTAVPSHPEEAKIPGPKGHNRGLPNAGSPAATPKLQADKVMPPQSAPRSASKPVLSPPKVAARPSESVHVPAATMPAGRSNSSKEIGTAIAIEALFIIVELALQRWVQQSFAKDLQAHAEKMVQDQLTAERGRLEAAVMARQPEITDWQAHGIGAVLFVELEMDWQSTDIGAVLMKVSLPRLAVAKQGEIGLAPRRPDMSIRRYFVDLSNQMVGRSVDHQIVQILLEGTGY